MDNHYVAGYGMSGAAADLVYEGIGTGLFDVDEAELHDCFPQNELITYEALGFCPEGGAERFIEDCDHTYGGRVVTNPSGGLLSKRRPLGATAKCTELARQLRSTAGPRQVPDARLALRHDLYLGGACAVTLYHRRH